MSALRAWLRTIGMEQHADLLEANEVDLETLRILSDSDLQELGIPFGPRKRLRHALHGSEPTSAPAASLTPASDRDDAGERRQLTVLFCDMVGFTELASRIDPEVLQDIVRRYEEVCTLCITRYDGYVFQRLGDGVVAFFGFPIAHEDEAERAVRAALDMVAALARTEVPEVGRLRVRIGLASGVVVISSSERSAVGETMNLASRLQGLANPGEIVISERVYRLAGGALECSDLGEQALKGIAATARAWRVHGVKAGTTRFEAATRQGVTQLVGRGEELDALLARWERAKLGHGQVARLSGEPGVGKSRLVLGLLQALERDGVRALRMQCSPFQGNSALFPFIDHLSRSLSAGREDSPSARLDWIHTLVVGQRGWRQEDAAYLAGLFGLPWRDRYSVPPISPRRLKDEGTRVLIELFATASLVAPTVLLVEDVHWADPSTLDVLAVLVARAATAQLLVVLTHRPEFQPAWPEPTHVLSVELRRLDASESRALVLRIAGRAMPESLVKGIVTRSDGIPLFIEELTRAVLETDLSRGTGERPALVGMSGEVVLPATLRDSLMARLDRVTAVKEIAQIGAVIGREFSRDLLATVARIDPDALTQALRALTESGLAYTTGTGQYTFKHALVHDVAYDSMLRSRRQELHRAIAARLDRRSSGLREMQPELLARHYGEGGMDAEAIPLWRHAGELAMQRLALPEAIAFLRHALSRVVTLPDGASRDRLELDVRTLLGPAIVAHRGWAAPEVSNTLEPAWQLNQALGDRDASIPVLHGIWVHFMTCAKLATSLHWAELMLEQGRATDDERLMICGHRAAMTTYFWMGRFYEAKRHGDEVLARYDPVRHGQIAQRTNSDPLTGDGIYRAHYLWMLGHPDQARAVSERAAEHARQCQHPFDIAFVLTLGAQAYEYCGDADRLHACADEAMRIGREFGVPLMSEMMAEISRGAACLLRGEYDDGIAESEASIARLERTGHRVWIAYLYARLGMAIAQHGDPARGLLLIEASLARDDCREERAFLAEMHRLRGVVLTSMGRTDEGEQALREALAVAQAQGARGWELRAATSLARLLRASRRTGDAVAVLTPVLAWFDEGHDTRDVRSATALLRELGDGTLRVDLTEPVSAPPFTTREHQT